VDERDRVELAGGQLGLDRLGHDWLAPLDLQRLGLLAALLGHVEPLVRKRAAHAVEHFLADEIADRTLHHAPGRAGADEDRLLGVENLLQLRVDVGVERLEILRSMPNHRARKRAHGFFRNFHRAGDEQFDVGHKNCSLRCDFAKGKAASRLDGDSFARRPEED
jgi:hypothetical protein